MRAKINPSASRPMTSIVRVAIVAVTVALFFSSSFNALVGHRDIAVLLALATPLGISAWGFARAGHNEEAMVLLACVLITVVTLILILNRLGVHDVAITVYSGIVLVGALLLSRRSFVAITGLTLFAATGAFVLDMTGHTASQVAAYSGWPQLVQFLAITVVLAVIGRVASEKLLGSLGDAHDASIEDPITGLANRHRFLAMSEELLKLQQNEAGCSVLVLADLDGFRRVNVVIGHRAGDGVLVEVARRLRLMNRGYLTARIGDDEFAVLGTGLPDEQAAASFARAVHDALNFDFSGVSVRNAAGFARFPRDAHGIESLLLAAESSLTSAKGEGRERFAGPADRI
jgi:diguanylate cyclase (GGDEF)-like protein